jgi:hypothetical protein
MLISEIRRTRDEESIKDSQLQALQARVKEQARLIEEMRVVQLNHQRETTEIIDRLPANNLPELKEYSRSSSQTRRIECSIS